MIQALYEVPAPAKLNLFLHVLGRRDDAYHLIQSAFVLLDWCDRLHFERRADGRIQRHDWDAHGQLVTQPGPQALPPEDLCVRAALALQQASGCAWGVDIHLQKQVPSSAGMGGGSSDAASCLLALNRLWNLDLSRQTLQTLGLQLGADVPFFLGKAGAAWVEGIGERMQALSLPTQRFFVLKPSAGVFTRDIFSAPALTRDTKPATISGFGAQPFDFGHNDLQSIATALCPSVGQALNELENLGLQARMTGSGSAVFAVCDARFEAPREPAWPSDWTAKVCQSLQTHPLADW